MKKNNWKKREGVVFSTDPDFLFSQGGTSEDVTVAPGKQQLRVELDRTGRAGKQVTLISGFVGTDADRLELCRKLKTTCGAGGSVKGNDILIQGDWRTRVGEWLTKSGYRTRVI
jgi:translation initiation factor 1